MSAVNLNAIPNVADDPLNEVKGIVALEKRISDLEEKNYAAMLKKEELALEKEKHEHEKHIAESKKLRDITRHDHDLLLEKEKHQQELLHEKTSHEQSTRHKKWEFWIFTVIKVALTVIVLYFVYVLASRTINYVGNIGTIDQTNINLHIAVIIAGISSSVILLVLLMKGVFATKTETTASDIPVGALIKAIIAAFKSSGKS